MNLTIAKEQILVGLQAVQNVVSTRTTLPILSNVLIRAEGAPLTFRIFLRWMMAVCVVTLSMKPRSWVMRRSSCCQDLKNSPASGRRRCPGSCSVRPGAAGRAPQPAPSRSSAVSGTRRKIWPGSFSMSSSENPKPKRIFSAFQVSYISSFFRPRQHSLMTVSLREGLCAVPGGRCGIPGAW